MADKKKVFALKGISLDEVSLVDVPANPGAKVVLYKRDGASDNGAAIAGIPSNSEATGGTDMPTENAEFEKLKTELADLKKTHAEMSQRAEKAEAEIAKRDVELKKSQEEMVEFNGEKIAKSAVPAPVLKALEAQAAQLKKMEAEAKEVQLTKRGAQELPNLTGTPLQKGKLLDLVDSLPEADKKSMHECLKSADAAVKKSFTELGSVIADENSPEAKLEKMASDYKKANAGVSFEQAYAEVSKSAEGLALRKQLISN